MFGHDIGIDLGTTSTIIYAPGKGVVLSEPSVVAYNTTTEKMMYAGKKALPMVGRNPQAIKVIQPLSEGVISDYNITEQMIRYFMQRVIGNTLVKPRVMVCMPSIITNVEKRTIVGVLTSAGARKVCLIEEPLAAALGCGLDITQPTGTMVVDIGGGTTDIAVISMGSMALTSTIKTASNDFDEAIVRFVRQKSGVLIGIRTAEELKREIGCAYPRTEEVCMVAKGRDVLSGLPRSVEITSADILEALEESLEAIKDAVRTMFEKTPPELVGDISASGILLTGGGALLHGMEDMISNEVGIPVHLAEDPVNSVAIGTGVALKRMNDLAQFGYKFMSKEDVRVG